MPGTPLSPAASTPAALPPAAPVPPDRAAVRLLAFGFALVLTLGAGFGVGRLSGGAVGPDPDPVGHHANRSSSPASPRQAAGGAGHGHDATPGPPAGGEPAGLSISGSGYRLVPERSTFGAGAAQVLRFRVLGPTGSAVTAFPIVHDKPLHLVLVRRDLTGYQHLHPVMAPDGTWTVPLTLPTPGAWRAYADFTVEPPGGDRVALTLGVDLHVAGAYQPRPLPPPARTVLTTDGYEVRWAGDARVGVAQPVLFRITRDGSPVSPQPYLGAYGHLVLLREGDLAYVHVHAEEQLNGEMVKFWLTAPSPGRYRMFLDVLAAGSVRHAAFTLDVS